MNEQNQQPQQTQFTLSQFVGLVLLACHVWFLPLELLLRRRFGSRYIDGWLLAACIWPMMFCGFLAPDFNPNWTVWAFWLILLAGIYHRFVALRLDRKGYVRHSEYPGVSILSLWFGMDEKASKMRGEPIVLLFMGLLGVLVSPSLMLFILGGMMAGIIKQGLIAFYHRTEELDLRDARIEQEFLANRLRDWR